MVGLIIGDANLPDSSDTHNGAIIFPRDIYRIPGVLNYTEQFDAITPAAGRMVTDFSMPTAVNTLGAIIFFLTIENTNTVAVDDLIRVDYLRVGYTDFTTYTTIAEIASTVTTTVELPASGYSGLAAGAKTVKSIATFLNTPVTVPAGTFLYFEYSIYKGVDDGYSLNLSSYVDDPTYVSGVWVPIRYTV